MQAVIESKIQATHRLQKNGRWNQASLYRERERNRLRDAGWKRADAREEAWRLMIERFQPGGHDAFSSGCTLEFFPPILVDTAEQPVLSIVTPNTISSPLEEVYPLTGRLRKQVKCSDRV